MSDVITRVIPVQIYGMVPRSLTLRFDPADPVAVELRCQDHRWHVARRRLALGLSPGEEILGYEDEGAAMVHVSRLPGPCATHVLLIARAKCGRWPMSVSASALIEFLTATYLACPPSRERQLVESALADQLSLFDQIHGG